MIEQATHQLQGHVLERKRGAVEQLLHPLAVADLHQRHHGLVAELGIRLGAQPIDGGAVEVGLDEGGHHGCGTLGVAGRGRQVVGQTGPLDRHVQATVGGQAG